ncbi:MAG: CDP-diacylglycerol-serine O-phosphatidyltransferase [Verrucomicrobiales bacterium]|nr:CDP-diacylglycerol-serine O-phosphatidyltransferase [Verrucomicrobiales bacterium]
MLRTYTWADACTIGNATCGVASVFCCLHYLVTLQAAPIYWTFILIPLALVFDIADGHVARRDKKRQSLIGADLDSLADVISFGVAPAVLGYTLGLRGFWDCVALTYFVVCGVSRLARFNATSALLADPSTGKVKYFEGTPIPSSVILVILLAIAFFTNHVLDRLWLGAVVLPGGVFHWWTLLYILSGSAMISATLRVPKP